MKKSIFFISFLSFLIISAAESNLRPNRKKRKTSTICQVRGPEKVLQQQHVIESQELLSEVVSSELAPPITLLPTECYQCSFCMGIFRATKEEHDKVCYTLNATIFCAKGCGRTFKKPSHAIQHAQFCTKK